MRRRSRSTCPAPRAGSLAARRTCGLPLRIDRAEEEQPVAQDGAADRGARIAQSDADGVHGALDALHRLVSRIRGRRAARSRRRALEGIRAALGHDVDDAAGRLAELRPVAAGLHLDFLDEVVRRAVTERAEHDRVRAERAVAAVGDVHAVHDVLFSRPDRRSTGSRCRRPPLTPGER